MNVPEKIGEFKKNGYCNLEAILSIECVKKCNCYLSNEKSINGKNQVYNCLERDPNLFLELAANEIILDFCEAVMGPFVQLDGLTIVGLPIKSGVANRGVSGWHRDPWAKVPQSTIFERPLAVNALAYLQPLNEENGPLRVCPGSHRFPLTIKQSARRSPHELEKKVTADVGDVVLIHNNLVHTGTEPVEQVIERGFVSIFYNLSWLKQTISLSGRNYEHLLARFRKTNDRRMLRLLGADPTLLERNDTGFLVEDEAQWVQWIIEDRVARRSF